jgi:hypothetical protein
MTLVGKSQAFICAALVFWSSAMARAQLGQSVQRPDRQLELLHLQKSETRTGEGYRYTLLSSDDLVVKQFVNPATNSVFGTTWKGRRMPDLMALLGFDPYTISGPGVTRSLHATRIQTDMLSIEIVALMGRFQGRAVRADLLPQGVPASVVTP